MTKRSKPPKDAEFRFSIDAFTIDTLPMARLAEYLMELATIVGDEKSVHFRRLEEGSAVPVYSVEGPAIPKVQARARAVSRGDGDRRQMTAYRRLNSLLRQDNAVGELFDADEAVVLRFPGRETADMRAPTIVQEGTVEGIVMRVGGTDATVPVLIERDGEQIAGCFTTKALAREIAVRLFEPTRLIGKGTWTRNAEGKWELEKFQVTDFEPLDARPLSDALASLAATSGSWGANAFEELLELRQQAERGNRGRR